MKREHFKSVTRKGRKLSVLLIALAVSAVGFSTKTHAAIEQRNDYLISGSFYNNYVIMGNGSAFYSAGSNSNGKLGAGLSVNQSKVPVEGIGTDFVMVRAGLTHTVMLKDDGTIWSFGYSSHGELGTGNKIDTEREPYLNTYIDNVKEIGAGGYFTLALKNDGTVWSYGENNFGQLGNGSTIESVKPVKVSNLSNITRIDAGEGSGGALDKNGNLWVWGQNASGLLGQGDTVNRLTPVLYPATKVKDFSIGEDGINVLTEDGIVYTSGLNTYGELGIGKTPKTKQLTPAIVNINDVIQVSRGETHSLVLKKDGTVWSWGVNSYGPVGDGTTVNAMYPVQVLDSNSQPLQDIVVVNADGRSSVAVNSAGVVYSWGRNTNGQLGIDSTIDQKLAIETLFPNIFD
ncbi:hypothetical protein A3842_02435 [Paenibacillus sp. P3E]|uniref:RCC1 domain-containing protein n=1 Tax=Paenibacillus sp. P3E TaxID=1349435 RepID=UPI00093E2F19|nr:hypothetical protein [Paenibacillus sp. P3E]OKP92288.1 hypothetical protein A3842_02435 [Paenibacillus sp. P3E]